jgi:hypothetical protein
LAANFVEEEGRLKAEAVVLNEVDGLLSYWLEDGSECAGHYGFLHGYLVFLDSNYYKFDVIL